MNVRALQLPQLRLPKAVRGGVAAYDRLLKRRPYFANAALAAVLCVMGDVGCQLLYERQQDDQTSFDSNRTGRFVGYRVLLWAPVYTTVQFALDRVFGGAATALVVMKKVAIDQLIWTPPAHVAFFSWMAVTDGRSFSDATHWWYGDNFWDGQLWSILKLNWPYWTCIHALTFSVVPLHYRMMWITTWLVLWNGVLSSYARGD